LPLEDHEILRLAIEIWREGNRRLTGIGIPSLGKIDTPQNTGVNILRQHQPLKAATAGQKKNICVEGNYIGAQGRVIEKRSLK